LQEEAGRHESGVPTLGATSFRQWRGSLELPAAQLPLQALDLGSQLAGDIRQEGRRERRTDPDGAQEGSARFRNLSLRLEGASDVEIDFRALPARESLAIDLDRPAGLSGDQARRAGEDPWPGISRKVGGREEGEIQDPGKRSLRVRDLPRMRDELPQGLAPDAKKPLGAVSSRFRSERPEKSCGEERAAKHARDVHAFAAAPASESAESFQARPA